MSIFNFNSKDLGIDLGTANILITLKNKGIVLREPSVVAIDETNREILATGKEAKDMLGKTPEKIKAIRPMKNGAIADFTATSLMIKNMMRKILQEYNIGKPRVVVGIPSGLSDVEKRAVEEAMFQCGAREVYLVDEPMASAIGAGLNVLEPNGKMIVDIGGGTTEVAIISLGGIVTSTSIKVAGNAIDEAIVSYLKRNNNIAIGLATAEKLKMELGNAEEPVTEEVKEIRGRDLNNGLPKNVKITSKQIYKAMQKPIGEIVEAISKTFYYTKPELISDIIENGIYLSGGGALVRSLDNVISQKLSIQTFIADSPLDCVAIGTGKIIEDPEEYKRVLRRK